MKTIVISAVNLNVGGTLTILRECLAYLSDESEKKNIRVIALVHKRELCDYSGIEYIELPWAKRTWISRLWCEYVTMRKLSRKLAPVALWFSLHDTTPNVSSARRAVYCHNSFPFYKPSIRELFHTPKIVLFSLFSKWIYRINIYKNDYIVLQQQWIKDAFVKWFNLPQERIIVSPPEPAVVKEHYILNDRVKDSALPFIFTYPSSANSHKNFEVLCKAAQILTNAGIGGFEIHITIAGNENAYARWLYKKWNHLGVVKFRGFLSRQKLYELYQQTDALVFPSFIESWGLPISEFSSFNRPMLLADLPYAYETSSGSRQVCFFDPRDGRQLADKMQMLISGDKRILRSVRTTNIGQPVARDWHELFSILLQ